MKLLIYTACFFLGIIFFQSCTQTSKIDGRFTNSVWQIAGEEFRFNNNLKRFKYFYRGEGNIKNYSTGKWSQVKNKIIISGYNSETIRILDVESKINDSYSAVSSKLDIKYKNNSIDTFINVYVILNNILSFKIKGDTSLSITTPIKSLQVKAFMKYDNVLFTFPPTIDTLLSRVVEIGGADKAKMATLSVDLMQADFYRIKLSDTINAKNRRTLFWHSKKFKKITGEY